MPKPNAYTAAAFAAMAASLAASVADAAVTPPAPAPDGGAVGYIHRDKPARIMIMRPRDAALTGLLAGFPGMGVLEAAAIGGTVGAIRATDGGPSRRLGLDDPANVIAREIAASYGEVHHLALAPAAIPVEQERQVVSKHVGPSGDADARPAFLVEASTSTLVTYFSFDWARYGLTFTGDVKVIDARTGATVARGVCRVRPEKTPQSPTFREMVADNAAVMKAMIAKSAQSCLEQIRSKVAPDAIRPSTSAFQVADQAPALLPGATYTPPRRLPTFSASSRLAAAPPPGRVVEIRVQPDGSIVEVHGPFN